MGRDDLKIQVKKDNVTTVTFHKKEKIGNIELNFYKEDKDHLAKLDIFGGESDDTINNKK